MANTLNEYYQGQGKPLPSVQERGGVYEQYGLGPANTYAGTASQNNALLGALQGGSVPTSTTTPTPTTQPTRTPAASGSSMTEDQMVNAYIQHGWGEAEARADIRAGGYTNKEWLNQGSGGGMPGAPVVPNLQDIYDSLFNTPEIKAKKDEITATEEARDKAIGEIQNNPWFSQATRGGKIAGIQSDAERKLTRINNELVRMTSDAQVQYNVKMNQYTLDREAYNTQLELFTSLLNAGAFTNASEQDKSAWAVSTGIPISMIDSIVAKQKNDELKLETFDDGINQYVIALDSQGNVVNRTIIGKSKPTAGSSDNGLAEIFKLLNSQNSQNGTNGWEIVNPTSSTYEAYETINQGGGLNISSLWTTPVSDSSATLK